MHRTVKVALGGAALLLGVVVGLPSVASATPICNPYTQTCVTPPVNPPVNPPVTTPVTTPVTPPGTPVVGGVDSPGSGGESGGGAVGGGSAGGGTAGGGNAGGGSVGGTSGGAGSGESVSSGRGAVNALPFTGDEILVLSLAGAAALAAGAALTVAGRRRGATTA